MIKIITKKKLRSLEESSDRAIELEQTLSTEREEMERLAQQLAEAGTGFNGLATVLCTTFATQLDKSRELGERQTTDLMTRIETVRQRHDILQNLVAAAMRHVGRLEGLTRNGEAVSIDPAICQELLEAADRFDRLLMESTS